MKKSLERTTSIVSPTYIRHHGIFNYEELLKKASAWFSNYKYYWTEKEQTEKEKLEGQETVIEWKSYRKIDDYFMFYINVVFFTLRYEPIVIEEKGKKIKTGKGELQITIKSDLVKDYNEQFKGKFLGEYFRVMYEKFFIKRRRENYEGKLLKETYDFHDTIKKALKYMTKENRKFY